jgi:pimeloyl-ACP methyl ester carboxylesterase
MNIKIPVAGGFIASYVHTTQENSQKLALLLPGFLDSKDYPSFVKFGETLSAKDFTTVRFNPTGTWESSGTIADYSISQYLRDVQAVINYCQKEWGRFEDIILIGHSLGGLVSLLYAAKHPEISAIMSLMAPSSYLGTERLRERTERWRGWGVYKTRRDIPDNLTEKKQFAVPFSYMEDALQYDAKRVIAQIHVPMLFIAGELDDAIPPAHVRELFVQAREPKKFASLPGVVHDFRTNEGGIAKVAQEVEIFLQEQGL